MITIEEAAAAIREHLPPFPAEEVLLHETAGRILREEIQADRDMPPFDRVMMDGIALAHPASAGELRVEAIQGAGQERLQLADPRGSCIRVMTGAMLPRGCDCVIPVEDLEEHDAFVRVREPAEHSLGQFIHRRASDRKAGDILLRPGRRLASPQTAIIAGTGQARVQVTRLPSVALISTGDELIAPGRPVEPHQIRPSSTYGLHSACENAGIGRPECYHLPDDLPTITRLLEKILAQHDLLVLSGGVSKGLYDHVPEALESLGVKNIFHRISQRPGKPFWFGVGAEGTPVFALPGNPVSTMVCFHRLVLPAIRRAMHGEAERPIYARLAAGLDIKPGLTGFQAVRLGHGEDGHLNAMPVEYHGSGDYAALGDSDGFVELERGQGSFPTGSVVPYIPWE